jgi:hypothetical protein
MACWLRQLIYTYRQAERVILDKSAITQGDGLLNGMKKFRDFALEATDGEIGSLDGFYFDDIEWTIRYLIFKPHKWLSGRKVLVSPVSLGKPDMEKRRFPTTLSKAQIARQSRGTRP